MKELNKQEQQILISILNNEIKLQRKKLKNLDNVIYNLKDKKYWEKRKNGCRKRIEVLLNIISKYENTSCKKS